MVTGRIERGIVKLNEEVEIIGLHDTQKTVVTGIEMFNKQLEQKQLIVGKGTIVDATIKQAQATPSSNKDQDANFTKKRGKTYYGYKGHIAIDEDSQIIKRLEFTKASVHDSNEFDNLVDYTEEAVFADKGYANKPRRKKLELNGIFDGILEKGYRNKPLSKKE